MVSKYRKHYLFASDFDQTLTFNDTGYVLSEMLGISVAEFERKAKGMAKLNLVQQGAELSYLPCMIPSTARGSVATTYSKWASGSGSRKTSSRFTRFSTGGSTDSISIFTCFRRRRWR